MKKSFGAAIAAALIMFLGSAFIPNSAGAAQTSQASEAFTFSTMLRSGDPVVGGGSFSFCKLCEADVAGIHALNDAGQALISGFLSDDCSESVFIASNRTGTRIANFCDTTAFGRFSLFARADINDAGQVALNMGPEVGNNIIDMLLVYSEGQLNQAVADGEQAPTGDVFGYFGFSEPSINNNGDLGFTACFQDSQGTFTGDGVFVYSGGKLRKVAVTGDPSPTGGQLSLTFVPPTPAFVNDNGDVLFFAGAANPGAPLGGGTGMFLARADGTIEKVQLGGDEMPNGSRITNNSLGDGTLSNKGDVVFGVNLQGNPKIGIFLYQAGQTTTILASGQPTPIGGTFKQRFADDNDNVPKINDNDSVAVLAKVVGGSSPEAIFLASTKAIVKVAAVGDRLPTGEKIKGIDAFSLNNLGQVAFFAHFNDSEFDAIGLYLATPTTPALNAIQAKGPAESPKLIIEGQNFITNDSTILINGQPVATTYPTGFQQNGGTTTRLISQDPQLAQLLPPGQSVQITVTNSLTARQSTPMTYTR
jgi:hypothetical protein